MSDYLTRFAPSPTGYLHLGHAAVQLGDVLGEDRVPVRGSLVEQDPDLLQRHAGRLVAQDGRDPHDVVLPVAPPASTVAPRTQQSDLLPVPQDVGGQAEAGRRVTDRPGGGA
mgnify:CR=1 FL=1